MKKRTKLVTTIASLCLAVALMAFGVYAATTVTLTVSSSVSFTVSDVFVVIEGSAKLGEVEKDSYSYTSYETTAGGKQAKAANTTEALTWTVDADDNTEGNQEIQFASNDTVTTWTIKVTNNGSYDVSVSLSNLVFKAITGTYRDAKYVVYDSENNQYATAANFEISNVATTEATYTSGDWSLGSTDHASFVVAPTRFVEVTLTRTLEDLSTNIAANAGLSVTGSISVSKAD